MKIAVFDTHRYDETALSAANVQRRHALTFFEARLNDQTVELAAGFDAVCPFVNCRLTESVLARLLTFPNVLITSHQGFLTREALAAIADTTLANASAFERGEALENEVRPERA